MLNIQGTGEIFSCSVPCCRWFVLHGLKFSSYRIQATSELEDWFEVGSINASFAYNDDFLKQPFRVSFVYNLYIL